MTVGGDPLPGLIYPMLGRLLEEGLIVETDGGRYTITPKGVDIASDIESVPPYNTEAVRCNAQGR